MQKVKKKILRLRVNNNTWDELKSKAEDPSQEEFLVSSYKTMPSLATATLQATRCQGMGIAVFSRKGLSSTQPPSTTGIMNRRKFRFSHRARSDGEERSSQDSTGCRGHGESAAKGIVRLRLSRGTIGVLPSSSLGTST